VCLQGGFGALTVTMKLFPAIVTLHLLGAYGLLALLTVQAVRGQSTGTAPGQALRPLLLLASTLLLVQALSGAWVSTNYAVLACADFPQCHGSWWPEMDFAQALSLWRPLGTLPDGTALGAAGLTAIHFLHRLLALCTVSLLGWTAWRLHAAGLHRAGRVLAGLVLLQVLTGISNVVLGWPLLAALLHTGGAGAMLVVLVGTLVATRPAAQGLSAPWALKGAR
jgi:cytochrome c oxidase assembly protein subunit 15